jgi:hypothetical protein
MKTPISKSGLIPTLSTVSAAMNASPNRTITASVHRTPHRRRMPAASTASICTAIAGQAPQTNRTANVKVIETKIPPDSRSGPRAGNGRASATTARTAIAQNSGGSSPTLPTADSDLSQSVQDIGSATMATSATCNLAPTVGSPLSPGPSTPGAPKRVRL